MGDLYTTGEQLSTGRYASLFHSMSQGLCILEAIRQEGGQVADYRYLEVNRAFLRHVGTDSPVGMTIRQVEPEPEEWILKLYSEVMETQQPRQFEAWMKTLQKWIAAEILPMDERDQVGVLFRDVTDQRLSQEAMVQAEERYQALFESIEQGFCTIEVAFDQHDNPTDYRFIEVSPSFERQTGIKNGAGRWMREIAEDQDQHWFDTYGHVALTGEPARFENFSTPLGRWWQVYAFRITGPRRIAVLFRDITDQKRADAALRESEERYRAIVETVRDYAIFTTDAEGLIQTWPRGAQEVFGWTADDAVGRHVRMTFTPEDQAKGAVEEELTRARDEGHSPNIRWHMRKDGTRVFIEGAVRPLTDATGRLQGFVKVGQDVTARLHAQERLRQSEERLRQFGEASSDVLWIWNARSLEFEYLSPAFDTIFGVDREAVSAQGVERWAEFIAPEDRPAATAAIQQVRSGQRASHEFRIMRHGQQRWVRNTAFPLIGDDGEVQRLGGIGQDITDLKNVADRMQVLVEEMQHRTRNLIGVISSVARQTAATAPGLPAFLDAFNDRLAALSRVQGLLSRKEIEPITLGTLIDLELRALGAVSGDRMRVEGPHIFIRPGVVQTLSLALHELATNARKYGALSPDGGRLTVTWELVRNAAAEHQVRLLWHEEGIVGQRPDRMPKSGYGRVLIEQALPYSLGASTTYELSASELRCTIELPLHETAGD